VARTPFAFAQCGLSSGRQSSPGLLFVSAENCRASPRPGGWGTRPYVVSVDRLVHGLGIVDHYPPLLMHPIEMMDWADTLPQRMGVSDRGGDVGFGQQNGFR
jgi:hypothetical protein